MTTIKTKAAVATARWRHGNRGSFLAAVSGSVTAAAQQKGAAITWWWQGGGGGQHGSKVVAIARQQQCKGSGDDRPKDRGRGHFPSALLLLPLLTMPPKNKGDCSLVAEQWQWRA